MPEPRNNSVHLVYGILFTIIGVSALIAFFAFKSLADNISQSVAVANESPTVDTVNSATSTGGADIGTTAFSLNEGPSTTAIFIHGNFTDANGCNDVATGGNVKATLHRTDATGGASCTADNNDCYKNNTATTSGCTGAGDTTGSYEAEIALKHFADATVTSSSYASTTNWTASVTATDTAAATGTATDTFEMNETTALALEESSINYGTVTLGGTSSEQTVTTDNTGNDGVDYTLAGSANMSCTGTGSDSLPVGRAHYNLTAAQAYASGTALTTSAVAVDANVSRRTSETATSTKAIFWALKIESTDAVGGTCTNTVTFTATEA